MVQGGGKSPRKLPTNRESVCTQMPQDHPTDQMAYEDQQQKCKGERQPKDNQEDIMVELANIRWSWISHVLRKPPNDITKEALYWTPHRRRRRGRPQLTWRRSVEADQS